MSTGICGHATAGNGKRGLCRRCYQRLQYEVILGRKTWAELEAEGRCTPRRPKVSPMTKPGGELINLPTWRNSRSL